ncbi:MULTISPECIES: orotidine-5'-phosphate decarboxylase [unclassified Nitratiruptor]|uniref:orotidine-5'-phosphate decarboxylase n=1 Tax=unclassified Nitratiruptor TaxID=2624044 RepID=UPI0019154BE2|nr:MULTISPECIES: orotidine-5'-phosphate decarboxylase [unclassified Nitratiruptor]BCD59819.1 orotidine-5'-phosphate decarboxylase [Nitratiruptor sp. YY08-10]BCD63743.1 orotidine-5'-phosphate decarboxylase [Nitratiruptor sp. YY08-14]
MQLCVALDLPSKQENIALAQSLKNYDIWLKVGLRSYIRDGKEFLEEIKQINPNFHIFLDLKLYDIPNTMADAAEEIAKLGVEMFNIHASAGKEAMQSVMQRVKQFPNPPLVLAVTVLTSFNEEQFRSIYNDSIENKAKQFAKEAYEAGLDGVVCSVYESDLVKDITSKNFITLTPGIRPFGENAGDQKRVADINLAKAKQVDFIVIGRPIYQAKNPAEVVERILTNL